MGLSRSRRGSIPSRAGRPGTPPASRRGSRCCNFLKAPQSSLGGPEDRSQPSLTLRKLAMINDRLAAHSFKQQTFSERRKKIVSPYKKRTVRKDSFCIYPSRLRVRRRTSSNGAALSLDCGPRARVRS